MLPLETETNVSPSIPQSFPSLNEILPIQSQHSFTSPQHYININIPPSSDKSFHSKENLISLIKSVTALTPSDILSKLHKPSTTSSPAKSIDIEYQPLTDSILLIAENSKLKVIKRDDSGSFPFATFADVNKDETCILTQDDFIQLIRCFNWELFVKQEQNVSALNATFKLFMFERCVLLDNEHVIIALVKVNELLTQMKTFLSTCINETENNKQHKSNLNLNSANNEYVSSLYFNKDNNEVDPLPFGVVDDNSPKNVDDDTTTLNEQLVLTKSDIDAFIIKDAFKFMKVYAIVNKLLFQLNMRKTNKTLCLYNNNNDNSSNNNGDKNNGDKHRFTNAYNLIPTFLNNHIQNTECIHYLSDKGFYYYNNDLPKVSSSSSSGNSSSSNNLSNALYYPPSLRLFPFETPITLPGTAITSDNSVHNIYTQLHPSSLYDTALHHYFPVYSINDAINSFSYTTNPSPSIELYTHHPTLPLLCVYTKDGTLTIYNYVFGIKKLTSFNVLKPSQFKPQAFNELPQLPKPQKNNNQFYNEEQLFSRGNNNNNFSNSSYQSSYKNKSPKIPNKQSNKKEEHSKKTEFNVNKNHLNKLLSMGFSTAASKKVLALKNNNLESALEYLLEHASEFEDLNEQEQKSQNKVVIGNWKCEKCTFLNIKGNTICEICESNIPKEKYEEFEKMSGVVNSSSSNNNTNSNNNNNNSSSSNNKSSKLNNNNNDVNDHDKHQTEFEDVLISNIHLIYQPHNNPLAPFVVVVVMLNYIQNKVILVSYKLRINIKVIREFISIENDNGGKKVFINKITRKKYSQAKDCFYSLLKHSFTSMNTLYPLFYLESDNEHLIPVEYAFTEQKVNAVYDSCVVHSLNKMNVLVLCETLNNKIKLFKVNITDEYQLFMKQTLNVVGYVDEMVNVDEMFKERNFVIDLKMCADDKKICIASSNKVVVVNYQSGNKEKVIALKEDVGLIKKMNYKLNITGEYIVSIGICNDKGSITCVNVEGGDNDDKKGCDNGNDCIDVDKLSIDDVSEKDLELLVNWYYISVRNADINVAKSDKNVKGIIHSDNNNSLYNKVYFTIDNDNNNDTTCYNSVSTLSLTQPCNVSSLELQLTFKALNDMNDNTSTNTNIQSSSPSSSTVTFPYTTSFPVKKEFKHCITNCHPIKILSIKTAITPSNDLGNLFTSKKQPIIFSPKAELIFQSLNNEQCSSNTILISSPLKSQNKEQPFGEGFVFLCNSIETIEHAKKLYSSLTYTEYEKLCKHKSTTKEQWYEYEPVCYIKMGSTEYISITLSSQRVWRYIYFIPTNVRDNINEYEIKKTPISISFFGIMQSDITLRERNVNINNSNSNNNNMHNSSIQNYIIDKFKNEHIITTTNVKVYGINSTQTQSNNELLLYETNTLTLNNVILDKTLNEEYYVSKFIVENTLYRSNTFDKLRIHVQTTNTNINNSNFTVLGGTCCINQITSPNVHVIPNCSKLISSFNGIYLNNTLLNKFNTLISTNLTNINIPRTKRISLLKYYSNFTNEHTQLKQMILNTDFISLLKDIILLNEDNELCKLVIDCFKLSIAFSTETKQHLIHAIETILTQLHELPLTFKGIQYLSYILNYDNTIKDLYKRQFITIIKQSVNMINTKQFQTQTHIAIKNYFKDSLYPLDTYGLIWDDIAIDNIVNCSYMKNVPVTYIENNYKDSIELYMYMNTVVNVHMIKLKFNAVVEEKGNDFNFSIVVYNDMLDEEVFRMFYNDEIWKRLVHCNCRGSIECIEIPLYKCDGVRNIGNRFTVVINVRHGVKDNKSIQESLKVNPCVVVVNEENMKAFDELMMKVKRSNTQDDEDIATLMKNKMKQLSDMKYKPILVNQNESNNNNSSNSNSSGSKSSDNNVSVSQANKDNLLQTLSQYQNLLFQNVNKALTTNTLIPLPSNEQTINGITNFLNDIIKIHSSLCELNPIIKMDNNLSLNMLIIYNLCSILCKTSLSPQDIQPTSIDLDLIISLIQTCLVNDSHSSRSECIYEFILRFYFTNNTVNQRNAFDKFKSLYLDTEQQGISTTHLISIMNKLKFDFAIIMNELKRLFTTTDNFVNPVNIKNTFYKASILLSVLTTQTADHPDIKNDMIMFMEVLYNNTSLPKEVKDLFLKQILSLLIVSFKNQQSSSSQQLHSMIIKDKFSFLFTLLFSYWKNENIKSKMLLIIMNIVDPYEYLNKLHMKDFEIKATTNEMNYIETLLIFQEKTKEMLQRIQSGKDIYQEQFDFILNTLNQLYKLYEVIKTTKTINNDINLKIQTNIKDIISTFINIVGSFNKKMTYVSNFSNINHFWNYLLELLEKTTIDVLFDNNNFQTLFKDAFLNLSNDLIDVIYMKFIKVLKNYITVKVPSHQMLVQLMNVTCFVIETFPNTNKEEMLFKFLIILYEVLLYGVYAPSMSSKTKPKITSDLLSFNDVNERNSFKQLFITLSMFIIKYINKGSFGGCVCNDEKVYLRLKLAKYVLTYVNVFVKELFVKISNDECKEDTFIHALRNYIIYMIFALTPETEKSAVPSMKRNVYESWECTRDIIECCLYRNEIIEKCLIEIMNIVRVLDDCTFKGIQSGKISCKKGITLLEKLLLVLEHLLDKFLVDDKITKYFAFELKGFKFFIDRIILHRQLIESNSSSNNDSSSEGTMSDNVVSGLNEELMNAIQNEDTFDKTKSDVNDSNNNNNNNKDNKNKQTTTSTISMIMPISNNVSSNSSNNSNNSNTSNNNNIYTGEFDKYKYEEFAVQGKLTLIDIPNTQSTGNITGISTINWSGKKKPITGQIHLKELRANNYYEESFVFALPHVIELKEIIITFVYNNIMSGSDKVNGIITSVYLECGETLDNYPICVKLFQMNDQQYSERSLVAFGYNFHSHVPDDLPLGDDYLQEFIDQITNCKAKFFKISVRRPVLLTHKYSHTPKVNGSIFVAGINFLSLYGVKPANTQRVLEYLQEKEKNVSIKIISKIITNEFIDTSKFIAQDEETISNIKKIYETFAKDISKHGEILSGILINVSKYNYNLGEWLLERLLNTSNSEIHAKLAVEITQNNPEYVNNRLNKFIKFIFTSLNKLSNDSTTHVMNSNQQSSDVQILNIGKLIRYFTLALSGLLISPYKTKITLHFQENELNNIINNIYRYSKIRDVILPFITLLLLPNDNLIITGKQDLQPKQILQRLSTLYDDTFAFEYLEIISLLVCNDNNFAEMFIQEQQVEKYCEMFIDTVNRKLRGKNMLYLMEMLKNMSFNMKFVEKVHEMAYAFKIFNVIKNKSKDSCSILVNNNSTFLANVVIFMNNCLVNYPDQYKQLAVELDEDLKNCRSKTDRTYSKNVFLPLLQMEKSVKVCVHPVDSNLQIMKCSYCSISSNGKDVNDDGNNKLLNDNSNSSNDGNKKPLMMTSASLNMTSQFAKTQNYIGIGNNSINKNNILNTNKTGNKNEQFIPKKYNFTSNTKTNNINNTTNTANTNGDDNNNNNTNIQSRILSVNYIDKNGNLNVNLLQQLKYYKNNNNPLSITRSNPILELPYKATISNLKELLASTKLPFKLLSTSTEIPNNTELGSLLHSTSNINNEIIDIYYEISSLRTSTLPNDESNPLTADLKQIIESKKPIPTVIENYNHDFPIINEFSNGVKQIITYLRDTVNTWEEKKNAAFWIKWIDDIEHFSKLPLFFSCLLRHQKCFSIIFDLISNAYDQNTFIKEIAFDASKYIYDILDMSFKESKEPKLRETVIELGIFNIILNKLENLTHEKPRKFEPNKKDTNDDNNDNNDTQNKKDNKNNNNNTNNANKLKGVGYGSDHTGDNKLWDISSYLESKKSNSIQITSIINLLSDFFDAPELKTSDKLLNLFLESSILPCLESAFRGGTLLDLSKEADLYYSYLELAVKLSKNPTLVPLLLDISKDYKPVQTESVYSLLSALYERVKVFNICLKSGATSEQSVEEKLSQRTIKAFNIISDNIKAYQTHLDKGKNYSEILKLPVEKSYPLLMQELSFKYMSMRDSNGVLKHHYALSDGGEAISSKMIRLAQEYADLTHSLPCESTNSIYVRVDKDNMDYMKVLIMGSEGTPYSNGAFEYDVFFEGWYPVVPPKVNLMTTGNGTVRFNPNLYSSGKVCLSLLGTWRGNSTENWDKNISTLLQVLISIQSIIMSELVYFNEPSCESEMGKKEGEARNEAYSNIVRYCNIKFAMIEQIKKPSKGFEEVIHRHFYLKKEQILKEVRGWIERSKTATASYASFSADHNPQWAAKMNQPKKYTKMLEDIYAELETVLNELPLPSELQQKTKNEKQAQESKNKQRSFENLQTIDMGYDKLTNIPLKIKELNIDNDDVKDRYSRYIGAMGIEAVKRQANANIFLTGANALGIEIAKNLILSGCKSFVIHDHKKVNQFDLAGQFFLNENDIHLNRAEASLTKLQQLNYYVKVSCRTEVIPLQKEELDTFGMGNYDVVILVECDHETMIVVDNYCRKKGIKVIIADVYGGFARVINDFGNEFAVTDKDGEEPKECMVKNINNETGEVTVLDGMRHEFVDNDIVMVNEVVGMECKDNNSKDKSINGKTFAIKVLTPYSFKLCGDISIYKAYVRNGVVRQIKTTSVINFEPISNCLKVNFDDISVLNKLDTNLSMSDYSKIDNAYVINLGLWALNGYLKQKKGNKPWNKDIANEIIKIAKTFVKKKLTEKELNILYLLSFTYPVQFPPLCAYVGGIVAQEAIKSITNKFTPINQVMFYDVTELMPTIDVKNIDNSIIYINYNEDKQTRKTALEVVLGRNLLNKINNTKLLVVGAGAIGCELLKNFAMIDVGCGDDGAIYVTDPDVIETSNLTRQFLFREKHLRFPKSTTAAAAVIQMNPSLNGHIFAKCDKLCEETEHFFSDDFFNSLDLVANALDNVNARRYVDSRCVSCRKPLLESGTLGPKGHVQVIIPFKTESYASQSDPDINTNDIPQCTLKMFPEEAIHCVEWARDQFGKLFTQMPKSVNKIIEEIEENSNDLKLIKKAIKCIKTAPITFKDCLCIARNKFNKSFVLNIKQLMYSYPIDKKDKDGKLFWSLPKRPPEVDVFDYKDEVCQDYIAAYGCLIANMFNIKIPYDNPRNRKAKMEMAEQVKDVVVEEFKPNALKAKEIENEVENNNTSSNNDNNVDKPKEEEINTNTNTSDSDNINTLIKELKTLITTYTTKRKDNSLSNEVKLTSTEFEKDNDANFHIDIIYAMSALRCRNYKLEIMDWIKVKIKAGRIIPALATTTAAIAGLQTIELVKIIKNVSVHLYRNSYLNLAIPFLQSSEPGQCKKIILREGLSTDLWDRWEVVLSGNNQNIKALFNMLKTRYLFCPKDVFKKKKAIYSYLAYKDKEQLNEEIINKPIDELIGVDKSNVEYVDLVVTFTKDEKSSEYLQNIPKVRVYFDKKGSE